MVEECDFDGQFLFGEYVAISHRYAIQITNDTLTPITQQYECLQCLHFAPCDNPSKLHVLLTAEVVDSDMDLHMPYDQNFNYYNMDEFLNDDNISQCFSDNNSFSALNSNIRSLCANYDKLVNILSAFSS